MITCLVNKIDGCPTQTLKTGHYMDKEEKRVHVFLIFVWTSNLFLLSPICPSRILQANDETRTSANRFKHLEINLLYQLCLLVSSVSTNWVTAPPTGGVATSTPGATPFVSTAPFPSTWPGAPIQKASSSTSPSHFIVISGKLGVSGFRKQVTESVTGVTDSLK